MAEWRVLMQTMGNNTFTLGLFAFNYNGAKSKAKKLSQGCKVLGITETQQKDFVQKAGVRYMSH